MYIPCDHCGTEVPKADAIAHLEDEQVFYFCTADCLESMDYTPEREEDDHDGPA